MNLQLSPYAAPGMLRSDLPIKKKDFSQHIINTLVDLTGIPILKFKTKCRKREMVLPRQMTMWFLRKYTYMTVSAIGEVFNRDHTTVLHSTDTIDDLLKIRNTAVVELHWRMLNSIDGIATVEDVDRRLLKTTFKKAG